MGIELRHGKFYDHQGQRVSKQHMVEAVAQLEAQLAEREAEVEGLKQQQQWIDEVGPPNHPDDERAWVPAMLEAKAALKRVRESVTYGAVQTLTTEIARLRALNASTAPNLVKPLEDGRQLGDEARREIDKLSVLDPAVLQKPLTAPERVRECSRCEGECICDSQEEAPSPETSRLAAGEERVREAEADVARWNELRHPLQEFVVEMELVLKRNDGKSHWSGMLASDLAALMDRQRDKLYDNLEEPDRGERCWSVTRAAVNLANYAMMIADNVNHPGRPGEPAIDAARGE